LDPVFLLSHLFSVVSEHLKQKHQGGIPSSAGQAGMPVPWKKNRRAQEKLLNGQQVLHFVEQRFEPVGFGDYRGDPGAMGVGVGNGVFVQSEKNDLRWRMSLFQGTAGVQATHARHRQVHDDQIRIESVGFFECVNAVHGFIHDVRRMHFERGSYDEPNHLVVIYD
jgi:hypothetical protein